MCRVVGQNSAGEDEEEFCVLFPLSSLRQTLKEMLVGLLDDVSACAAVSASHWYWHFSGFVFCGNVVIVYMYLW